MEVKSTYGPQSLSSPAQSLKFTLSPYVHEPEGEECVYMPVCKQIASWYAIIILYLLPFENIGTPKNQLLYQTGKKLFMFDQVGAYPGKHENISPLRRKVIHHWRHWEDNPGRRLGFWHWKTISENWCTYLLSCETTLTLQGWHLYSFPHQQNKALLAHTAPPHFHDSISSHFRLLADFPWKRTYQIHRETRGCHDET